MIIKVWSNLSPLEKQEFKIKALVYFPELFSNSSDKFGRLTSWLVTREAIVCPSVRDSFAAGGKGSIIIKNKTYNNIPRIFINLFGNLNLAIEILGNTFAIELPEYWGTNTTENTKI